MKAKILDNDLDKNRVYLKDVIPLDTPFAIGVEPSGYCNLKCNFCEHTLNKEALLKRRNHTFGFMSLETFDLLTDQILEFHGGVKTITHYGFGEPFLNKHFPEMLGMAYKKQASNRQIVITNGTLITKDVTDRVISGTDNGTGLKIKISLNGFDDNSFREITGVNIDFSKFMEQLRYLYSNKGNAIICIKAMTSSLDLAKITEAEFYSMFGDLCDEIVVENTVQNTTKVNYKGEINRSLKNPIRGNDVPEETAVCSAAFTRLYVKNNGEVSLSGCGNCLNFSLFPYTIKQKTLKECWESDMRHTLLIDLLSKKYTGLAKYCKNCPFRHRIGSIHDLIDPYADEILSRLTREE